MAEGQEKQWVEGELSKCTLAQIGHEFATNYEQLTRSLESN